MAHDERTFLDLVEDVRDLIVNTYLDRPSRLSLALCSHFAYRSHWDPKIFRFKSFSILDECASRGYGGLLNFAFESGAELGGGVVLAAVEGGHLEIVKWLLSRGCLAKSSAINNKKICHALAQSGNLDLCNAVFSHDPNLGWRVDLAVWFAYFGNPEIYAHLFPKSTPGHYFYAARGGHLAKAIEMTKGERDAMSFLSAALSGTGSSEVVEYALSKGATLQDSEDFLQAQTLNYHSFDAVRLCHEHFPQEIEAAMEVILEALAIQPRLDFLTWLLDSFPKLQLPQTFGANLIRGNTLVPDIITERNLEGASIPPHCSSRDRFDCVQLLLDRKGLAVDLSNVFTWATLPQMKYLFERASKTPNRESKPIFPLHALRSYLEVNLCAELDAVRFLLQNGAVLPLLLILVQMTNALELLEMLSNEFPNELRVCLENEASLMNVLSWFSKLRKGEFVIDTDLYFLYLKGRLSLGKMLTILTWLLEHGIAVSKKCVAYLDNLKHPKYTAELATIEKLIVAKGV